MTFDPGRNPARHEADYLDHALYESSDLKLAVTVRHEQRRIRRLAAGIAVLVALAVMHHWLWLLPVPVLAFGIYLRRGWVKDIRTELAVRADGSGPDATEDGATQ